MDEVPLEARKELTREINRLAENRNCKIICTSRMVGYIGGFSPMFEEVEIVPFEPQQVNEYVNSWFRNVKPTSRGKLISSDKFLIELESKLQISGLTQVPLVLSLVCSLYVYDKLKLPTRKVEIYITVTIFKVFSGIPYK